jgi:hypothetical protein
MRDATFQKLSRRYQDICVNVTAIDTHAVVKRLMAAGFTDEQAEAVTLVVRDAQDIDLSTLATKGDLAATKADLEKSIAATKAGLEKSMAEIKADLEKSIAATKADLEKSMAEIKVDLEKTRAGLEKSIADVKVEILKWMVSTMGIQTVVIIGAIVTLVRTLH